MPIHGRYQMQAFLEMRPRFDSEKSLIDDIIETVDKVSPDDKKATHGHTNLDRTIMASRMYDHANESLLENRQLATKKETLSYYTDLHGLDLIDSQGKPHRIDGRTTTSMASQIAKLFEKSSQEDVDAMLIDLRQRKLISKKAFENLSEHAQLQGSAYNVATDLAYQIQDARTKNKKLARQISQNDLLSNQTKTYINSGGIKEVFSKAYDVIRQGEKDAMSTIATTYQHAIYTNAYSHDTLLKTGKEVLTAINMGGGQLDEKAKLIAEMFDAKDYTKPGKLKSYAINGRDNIQSFIVTPPNGNKGNAYLFLTTNNKVGSLMEALNSDRFKDAFTSPTALRDSGIFEYGTFVTLPHLNTYPTGQKGINLVSVNQGPASEKFLMPELSVSFNANGKLRGYYNDPEYSILGLYRKVGGKLLDAVEDNDFERAYRIYQRAFNELIEDKPASSTYRYRDGKRMIHFGASDIMHAYEIRMHEALETVFKTIVTPGVIKDADGHQIYNNITAGNLNTAQQIVDNFGHVLGMDVDQFGGRYDRYFRKVMNSHEFKEFFHRRMVFGSPAEEKWFDGVYQQAEFNKPLYQVIKDFAETKDAESIFDHTLIKTLKELPPVDQITPLGSESSVARGAYFTKKHGSFVPFAGNYSTMRPMYVQQLNAMAFDINEMRKDIDVKTNTAFRAAQFGRDFTPISVGTQLLEEDTFKMMTALRDIEGTFTGEHDFITRVKTMDIDALQQAYARVDANKEALALNLQNILTAEQVSKISAGANGGIDYQSIFDTTLQYMKQEMSSTYQDKVFISSALQDTHLFMQRDPVKLQFNLDSVDIEKTRKILYDLLGDKDSVELDTDTIIGRRKNGTAIFYNKAKATLTEDNIFELLSEETNGLTRLATEFGDIMDNKMFFNGMEKATVHTINTHLLAQKIFGNQFDANSKEQLQIASTISSYLFNELSDGALAIGSFRFGKHGGLVGTHSIWNTITKNYLESNQGVALTSLLNLVAKEGLYKDLGEFQLKKDITGNRLVGKTGLASNTADFVDAVYAKIKADAQNAESVTHELSQRIVNEVNDLIANSSLNMTASRANMNEHLGVRLAVDQRMDQTMRMRGLRTARNVQPGEEIGLQALDMNYADELRRQAEAYNARGNELQAHGLNDLQKAINDISVGRNYERVRRNTTQQDMRRTLRGVVESIDYLDSQFSENESLRRGADYVHERGIVEVDAKTLLESTRNKGNIHLLRSGGTLEEAEQGLFYVNGKPSQFLQRLADQKGFILNDSTHSFWIDMSGYDVTVANPNGGARVAIDGFLLPIQNISDLSSDDGKLFFQTQQGKVAHFIDEIADTILKNDGESNRSVGDRLGDLYSRLMDDLDEQTQLLDKDSDLYKSVQQYILPNSHELLALDEAAPLLNDSPFAADVRKYNQQRKNILVAMSQGNGAYDKSLIAQYTEATNNFKEALQKLADSVVNDEDVFHALSTLEYNKTLQQATDIFIDGKQYHGLSVALSEEGVEKLGYSFGNIAMDIVADFEHNKNLRESTIERLDDFAQMMRAKSVEDSLEFRVHSLHGALQKEFEKELGELHYFGYQWDSTKNVTDELNRFMVQIRKGKFSEDNALFDKEIELLNDPNSFVYKIRQARSKEELDVTIRNINENIARRAEGVFKQSRIGQDFFANIGTYSEFMRFPALRSQPLVRILLDESMNGQSFMARITNPILSLLSNLDFDGDKVFLGNVANGSSILRTDSILFQQQDAIYKRFITTEAPELLREAILSMDGYVADNPNDTIFQKAKLLEIADGQAYDEGIKAYLRKMGFDEGLNLKLAENAGILEAAVRSKEMSAAFHDALPNTLLNTNMQVASLVARIRKNNIGYISTPNYKIKEALMQAQQYYDLHNDPKSKALISDALQGLTNMFSQAGGIFDMAEQKAIDVKHAKDGLDLSYATRYSNAMYNLMSMDYAQEFAKSPTKVEGRVYDAMYSAIRAIGPKTLGVKDAEDVAWFAKVLSERHAEQLSHEYLFDIIQQVQNGKSDIVLHGRTVDKETASILLQALPLTQLTDIVRTSPHVTEIFKNIVYHDSYSSISAYLRAVAGQEISEADYKNIIQRTFGYDHSSAFGPGVLDIFIDSESQKVPTFVQGNIYYTPYSLTQSPYENKVYVFDGMKDNQYLFTEVKSKGKGKSVTIGANNIRSLDNFFAPKGGITLAEFYNNPAVRQQVKDEATVKFTANVLNSLTISKFDKILTSKPTVGKNASWANKAARFQPWGWKFANHLLGQDEASIKATYNTLNQYAKAYNLGLASKIFSNNAPDSAAGMIRQVNEAIARRPRDGSRKLPSYQAHTGSWAAEAHDDFVKVFGNASIFNEYLERANNLPDQFNTENFLKQIEDLDQNLYNVANEIAEAEASFTDLHSTIEAFKSDKEMSAEVKRMQGQYDTRDAFLQKHRTFLNDANKAKVSTLQNSIYGANGVIKTQAQMDAVFNWRTATPGNMLVGFGSYFGKSFKQLSAQDIININSEAETLIKAANGAPLPTLEKYAIDTTVRLLKNVTPVTSVSAMRATATQSAPLTDLIKANKAITDTVKATKETKQSVRQVQQEAKKSAQAAAKATSGTKTKTLTGSILDSIQDMGVTKKHVGIAIGAMAALGITNKLLHRESKSPLARSESGRNAPPDGQGQSGGYQNGAPASSNVVYHQDNRSGLTFKVSAKTQRRINAANNGSLVRQAGGGNANVYTYNDTSGINDNWLANKFAELAQ